MQSYIGVKRITAEPMSREQYNHLRGWTVPEDENPLDDGYLVEYLDGGKSNHPNYVGYISWSPKAVFEKAYRRNSGLTFGFAIEALRAGMKLAREGWNGKGMFIYYVPPGRHAPTTNVAKTFFCGGPVPYREYLAMKTVDDEVVPWLASQSDVLAEDWRIVE